MYCSVLKINTSYYHVLIYWRPKKLFKKFYNNRILTSFQSLHIDQLYMKQCKMMLLLQVLRDDETEELCDAHVVPGADQNLQEPSGPQEDGDPHPQEQIHRGAGETRVLRESGTHG